MKRKHNKHLYRDIALVLAACLVIGLVLSVVRYFGSKPETRAYSELSFTFEGAQNGEAPNGYMYDVTEIASEEVVSRALVLSGMEDRYTADAVIPSLEIRGIYPEDMVEQMTHYNSVRDASGAQALTFTGYRPTAYTVTLYEDFDPSISQNDLVLLQKNIITSYREWFAESYQYGSVEPVDEELLPNYDYFQQTEMIESRLNQAVLLADQLAEKAPEFKLNGVGFGDASVQFSSIVSSDIAHLNALISMNALSTNLDRLKGSYLYRAEILQEEADNKSGLRDEIDKLLSTYSKSGVIYLSTSESISRIDTISSAAYDKLVDSRNETSDEISDIYKQIALYDKRVSEIEEAAKKNKSSRSAGAESLQQEITRAVEKSNETIERLTEMSDTLLQQNINEGTMQTTATRYSRPSLFSVSFIVTAIKTCAVTVVIGLIAALILIIINEAKELKKK